MRIDEWTQTEIHYLKNNYPNFSVKQLSNNLKRTEVAIRTRLNKINLIKHPRWNNDEIKTLQKYYHILTVNELMKKLNRSRLAILTKAYDLGLKSTHLPYDEMIINLYVEQQLSTTVISDIYCVNRSTIIKILKRNKIQRRTREEVESLKGNYITLNHEQRIFLEGLLLGDGSTSFGINKKSARFVYGDKHKDYISYIKNTLETFGLKVSKIYESIDKRYGCKTYNIFTVMYRSFVDMRNRFYPNGKKIIPSDLEITPNLLKNWFIGDGNGTKWHVNIATCGFKVDSCNLIVEKLKELNINSKVLIDHRGYPSIFISTASYTDFYNFMLHEDSYIPECYQYKFQFVK